MDQGRYKRIVFDNMELEEGSSRLLYTDSDIRLSGIACGLSKIGMNEAFEEVRKVYKNAKGDKLVGLVDIRVETYIKFYVLAGIPCIGVEGTPLVSKQR